MKQVFGAVYLQIVAAIVVGVLGVCLVMGSSFVCLYGRYLFCQFMYMMDSTLDIKRGGRKVGNYQRMESGELSEDEDHYNTGMRDTLTCNNGSNDIFLGDLPRLLEILKQRYLNICNY